jgi:GH15 family glucan-1,4-alpha-glucosidase
MIFGPRDPRLMDTAEFLLSECSVNGGFYQDIIHSGVNPYLTLHVAQVLLRAGDPRFQELVRTVARLASPTGQWPEAVHPRTGEGAWATGTTPGRRPSGS